jgi:aminoglycoside phosphotransferase (APT) family kinase protein
MPEASRLPLAALPAQGSSNALCRLGDDLLVRLPRQPGGSVTIDKEARWLPYVAPHLPVAVPEVVAVHEPALGYPERWSVVRWLDGDPVSAGSGGGGLVRDLAAVVVALRELPVPAEALTDPSLRWYRGDALVDRDADTRADLVACRELGLGLDLDLAEELWTSAMALPADEVASGWYHGDLVAENLLHRSGRLTAVLDFGGLGVGDPTVDLVVAWDVLDAPSRDVFRAEVDVDDATWMRGRAWALCIALMTFPYYGSTMPERCASRLAMARAVLDDFRRPG